MLVFKNQHFQQKHLSECVCVTLLNSKSCLFSYTLSFLKKRKERKRGKNTQQALAPAICVTASSFMLIWLRKSYHCCSSVWYLVGESLN